MKFVTILNNNYDYKKKYNFKRLPAIINSISTNKKRTCD